MLPRWRTRQSDQGGRNPPLDAGSLSQRICIGGLAFCWLFGIASLAVGLYLVISGGFVVIDPYYADIPDPLVFDITGGIATSFNRYAQEVAPLGLNFLVTICNDITGYIHTVSLRWALQREERLKFSSNLRLFTSARMSRANAWYTNLMMVVFMVISYASTSLLFIRDSTLTTVQAPLLLPDKNTFIC